MAWVLHPSCRHPCGDPGKDDHEAAIREVVNMRTYYVRVGHGGAVSTHVEALARIIKTFPPGQYEIMVTTQIDLRSDSSPWGLAIKREDGEVELHEHCEQGPL
jgi:hypothetical protein